MRLADLLDDIEQSSVADLGFHRKLAELAHNPLYMIMLDSISDVLLEIRRATMGNLKDGPAGVRRSWPDPHGESPDHDPEAAREAMRRHLARRPARVEEAGAGERRCGRRPHLRDSARGLTRCAHHLPPTGALTSARRSQRHLYDSWTSILV